MAKSLGSKNRLEELFGSIKIKDHPRMDHPLFRSRKNRGRNLYSSWSNFTIAILCRRTDKG